MANEFSITTATNKFSLDAAQRGEVTVTVSNATERRLQGRAQLEPGGGAKADWFKVDGELTRTLNVAESAQYTIKVAAPPGTPAGEYSVRLNMVGIANPDEEFSEGPTVVFSLKQGVPAAAPVAAKGFPWWIVVVVVGVVLVGGVIFGVSRMNQPAAAPTPDLTATADAQAAADAAATADASAAANATATADAQAAADATATAAAQAAADAQTAADATATANAQATADAQTAADAKATADTLAAANAQATANALAAAAQQATATAIAVATATTCVDQYVEHVETNNGAFIEFFLRSGPNGTVRSWQNGYHTQYQFPTCRGIGWSNAVFTCVDGTWVGNPSYYNDALCHGSSNDAQRDMRLGVK